MRIGPGTRALVTGASRGIGRAVAEALAARGATVGLVARSADELEALAADLEGEHVVAPADVGDRESVSRAVARVIEEAGGLDLVVANAGIAHYGSVAEMDVSRIEDMTRVNWLGTVYTVMAALPHLLDRAQGHLAIVSSGAALRTFPWAAAYGATKAAQRGFGEGLRHELSGTGVGLTVVYPGEVRSALHDHQRDRVPDWRRDESEILPPEAVADALVEGVESDARAVHVPREVRLLGALHGLSPRLTDHLLARLRGGSAAPRRD